MSDETNLLVEALDSHRARMEFDEMSSREALEKILSQSLLPFEREIITNHAKQFAMGWMGSRLTPKYDLVSREIWDLKREVPYGESGKGVKVPTLFRVNLDKLPEDGLYKIRVSNSSYHSENFDIQAEIPELTPEARRAHFDAIRHCASVTQEAFEDNLVGRILASNRDFPLPIDATYHLIWAPEKVELKRVTPVPYDPAIIMSYAGANMVVYQWDGANERPLGPMLKNFQEEFKFAKLSNA